MNNTATFNYQSATVTLAASSATELLTALAVFGLGTPGTNKDKGTTKPAPEKATETKVDAKEQAGNAASTPQADQGSAQPAGTGSEGAVGDAHPYNYNDISARVVAIVKKAALGRDKAASLLKEFGVDHANKLQLDQYVAFIDKADAMLGSAA